MTEYFHSTDNQQFAVIRSKRLMKALETKK
jgi:hypothetical protein